MPQRARNAEESSQEVTAGGLRGHNSVLTAVMTAPLATDTVMLMKETLFLSVKGCHSIGSDRKNQLMHPASIQQVSDRKNQLMHPASIQQVSDRKNQLMHPASIQQVWALEASMGTRTVLALHHTARVGGAV